MKTIRVSFDNWEPDENNKYSYVSRTGEILNWGLAVNFTNDNVPYNETVCFIKLDNNSKIIQVSPLALTVLD